MSAIFDCCTYQHHVQYCSHNALGCRLLSFWRGMLAYTHGSYERMVTLAMETCTTHCNYTPVRVAVLLHHSLPLPSFTAPPPPPSLSLARSSSALLSVSRSVTIMRWPPCRAFTSRSCLPSPNGMLGRCQALCSRSLQVQAVCRLCA